MDVDTLYPAPPDVPLVDQITRGGNTNVGFAAKVGIPPLVLAKRARGVTADGSGRLSDADEAAIAAALGTP